MSDPAPLTKAEQAALGFLAIRDKIGALDERTGDFEITPAQAWHKLLEFCSMMGYLKEER